MDYQKIMDTSGTYSIQEHLMAMRSGFKCSRLTDSLKENIEELKWGRNLDAKKVIDNLLTNVNPLNKIGDVDTINDLIDLTNSDQIINGTPHTFAEYFSSLDDNDFA